MLQCDCNSDNRLQLGGCSNYVPTDQFTILKYNGVYIVYVLVFPVHKPGTISFITNSLFKFTTVLHPFLSPFSLFLPHSFPPVQPWNASTHDEHVANPLPKQWVNKRVLRDPPTYLACCWALQKYCRVHRDFHPFYAPNIHNRIHFYA